MATDDTFDVAVIGAGIAGASVAAELAKTCKVVLLEQESQAGYHTTGRSAALFTVSYGPPVIRALSRASEPFFRAPDGDFSGLKLLGPRGALFIANGDQLDALEAEAEELKGWVTRMDGDQAHRTVPMLRAGYVAGALMDDGASDIEVDLLHQGYLKALRGSGGKVRLNAGVRGLAHVGDDWVLELARGRVRAPIVVNAAGAWVDEIARMAGVAPAGITPKRRTALLVAPPPGAAIESWPLVVDINEQFYLKPDAGRLLLSPADETPSPPCDAQPDEIDVAICVDRIETAFDLQVRRIDHKWAGLRSFLPDGCPLAGYDGNAPGFFWLAGQGGYGIQTAPALARAAAALVLGLPIPGDIADQGVDAPGLSRARAGLGQ